MPFYLARIIGCLVATRKEPGLEGKKLLLVQPIDASGKDKGTPIVATDAVGAGVDEIVIIVDGGKEAGFAFYPQHVPSDASVVGIVDDVFTFKQNNKQTKEP